MVFQTKFVAMGGVRSSHILDIFGRLNQQDFLTRLDMEYGSKREAKDAPKSVVWATGKGKVPSTEMGKDTDEVGLPEY